MSDEITPNELLSIINERDKHTQEKLIDILTTQKATEDTLKKVCDHIIVSEEYKRQDSEFKKEMREHVKFAEPILFKARDHQESRSKLFMLVASLFVAGVFGAFFSFK
jgi:hypothetical protein